jgi:nitronate monooxygenase
MTDFPAAQAFCARFGISVPIIQAPMAGVSTPALAAAVSGAGGLGSLGLGASDVTTARSMIAALRNQTNRAFNVNFFRHRHLGLRACRR